MAGVDLAGILSSIAELQQGMRGDASTERATVEQNQALRDEQLGAAQTLMNLSIEQAQVEGDQRLQLEQRKKATAEAFGTDILQPGNRIAYLAQEQAAAVDEVIYNSKRAATLREASLFDSPLEYLMARPFAGENDAAAEAAKQRAVVIDKAIDDINTQTQSTVTTQKAIQETFTKEQQALQLQQLSATASQKVAELRLGQNKDALADLETLRRAPLKDIELSVTSYNLVKSERDHKEMMAERAENRALRRQEMEERTAIARERLAQSKDANAMRAAKVKTAVEQLEAYNKGAAIFNRPPMNDPIEFDRMLSGPMKEQLATVMQAGMNQMMDEQTMGGRATPVISSDVGTAVMTLKSVGGRLPATAARTQDFLGAVSSVAQSAATERLAGKGKLTGDMMISGINSAIADAPPTKEAPKGKAGMISRMQQNVEGELTEFGGKVKNIYAAPDVATILTNKPDLAQDPIWKAIVEPAALATGKGMQGSPTVEQMLKAAELAVVNKTLSPDEAARGVSLYYKTAITANIANERYHSVGLPNPVGYNAQISTDHGRLWGADRLVPINAIDEAQVKHRLMLAISSPKNFSFQSR